MKYGMSTARATRAAVAAVVGVAWLASGTAWAGGVEAEGPLAAIVALEGEWVAVGEDGEPTDTVVSRYEVTSGGHVVLETMFPGRAHEMRSVYYAEGDDVVMTHYCAVGNHPRMRATPVAGEKRLTFRFDGLLNATVDDSHIHDGWLEWMGEDRVRSQWSHWRDGAPSEAMTFELVRRR